MLGGDKNVGDTVPTVSMILYKIPRPQHNIQLGVEVLSASIILLM